MKDELLKFIIKVNEFIEETTGRTNFKQERKDLTDEFKELIL